MANRTIDLEPQAVGNLSRAILDVTAAGYEARYITYDDYRPEAGVTILARKNGTQGKLVKIICKADGNRSILEIHEIRQAVRSVPSARPVPPAAPAPDADPQAAQPTAPAQNVA